MTSQPTLFDEQEAQLTRVTGQLAAAILRFCRHRLATGQPEFHAAELREYVEGVHQGAPGSPDRILRALRRTGAVDYRVIDRAASLYRIVSVRAA